MSARKHPLRANSERWLVSYADFVTLLFAFFVVLFAAGRADKQKQSQFTHAMQSAFDPSKQTNQQPPAPFFTTLTAPPAIPKFFPDTFTIHDTQFAGTALRIQHVLTTPSTSRQLAPGSVTMHATPEGLVISLHDGGFFTSGSADLRPEAVPALQRLAASLPPGHLRVEGHTDDQPISSSKFASNWELSTARATRIARLLLEYGNTNPVDLSAAGYAEFHPIASNDTEAGRLQNRRVDIILLRPPQSSPPAL